MADDEETLETLLAVGKYNVLSPRNKNPNGWIGFFSPTIMAQPSRSCFLALFLGLLFITEAFMFPANKHVVWDVYK